MATSSLERPVEVDEGAASALERTDRRRSTASVVRDAVLSATHIVEDSTELIGASVREELERFRADMARQALAIVAIVIGGGLLTAGLAMFLNQLVQNWALTFVIFGALYVAVAVVLQSLTGRESES